MAGDASYDLVMPFVVCVSQGGPHDDEAFVAGWRCAMLDVELEQAARLLSLERTAAATVRAADMPQVDLIAMRYGFAVEAEPAEGGWVAVRFRRLPTGVP